MNTKAVDVVLPVNRADETAADYAIFAVSERLPGVIADLEQIAEYLPCWSDGVNRARIKSVTEKVQALNKLMARSSQVIAETRP